MCKFQQNKILRLNSLPTLSVVRGKRWNRYEKSGGGEVVFEGFL